MKALGHGLSLLIIVTTLGISLSYAELPTRWEQIQGRYEADRALGLINLNKRYIEAFEAELKMAMDARKLEEANTIQTHIEALKAEITALTKKMEVEKAGGEAIKNAIPFLVGKSVTFPHNTNPDEFVSFHFFENGEANWVGLGGAVVSRAYRAVEGEPLKVFVWWPDRDNDKGYEITVSEDGKTSQVVNMNSRQLDLGAIEKIR